MNKRECFWLDKTKPDPSNHDRFLVSLVTENEPGHQSMSGRGACAVPWHWDEDTCVAENLKRYGLDKRATLQIVASSMRVPTAIRHLKQARQGRTTLLEGCQTQES